MMQIFQHTACQYQGTVLVGGDLIFNTETSRGVSKIDHNSIWGKFRDTIEKSDVIFLNYEGVISRGGQPRRNGNQEFLFRSDPAIFSLFRGDRRYILSFANNHSFDYGRTALEECLNLLKTEKIDFIGIGEDNYEAFMPKVVNLQNLRVSFLAQTDLLDENMHPAQGKSGVASLTKEHLSGAIKRARVSSDIVIVALHTVGNVYAGFSFFPDEHQKMYYRLAIDYGANIVVGHQPHGMQLIERYRDGLIFYSLGALLYDPKLAEILNPSDYYYKTTRIHGGCLVAFKLCSNGIHDFVAKPTRSTKNDVENTLHLVPDSLLMRVGAGILKMYTVFS